MKSKIFWIGRNKYGGIEVNDSKKHWQGETGFGVFSNYDSLCREVFEKTTGIKLKSGQVRKFRLVGVK